MKTLAIIGSTGSIGKTTLQIYKKNNKKFKLLYISCNKNIVNLKKQVIKFKPLYYHCNDLSNHSKNKKIQPIDFFIKKKIKIDYVVSGVSGFESFDVNFKLLKISKNLLIANKETIVCCGKIFLNEAEKKNCNIVPIDSEHYCINYFLKNFKFKIDSIKKIILMASGGPFLKKKINFKEKISNVIRHPTWSMGKKISVDSSTMANKVVEMFEAKILFNIPSNFIDVKIDNKSVIHSIIVLKNNLNFFIGHHTTMEIPISNSLNCQNNYTLKINNNLNLQDVDLIKFPLLKLGFKILNFGNAGMILFTIINERLVNKYLNNEIYYGDISAKLIKLFKKKEIVKMSKKCIKKKSDIYGLINFAKKIKL